MAEFYEWLTQINSIDFSKKSIILVGSGNIAKQYVDALNTLNIYDITVITNSEQSKTNFQKLYDLNVVTGGFEKNFQNTQEVDLVIITTPISLLVNAAKSAIKNNQTNILIEKPGSLYYEELVSLNDLITTQNVRIAYNRLFYPSFHKLKTLVEHDGGITSCTFDFTEWINKINFSNNPSEVYSRWGISNSLHVISMAMDLIGMPEKITTYQSGKLDWHKSGSTFVGSGISKKGIPFSYHGDWGSAGRWGIEVTTRKNSYRLVPLEELYVCPKESTVWSPIELKSSFPNVKDGLAEEISVMLSEKNQVDFSLPSLEQCVEYNKIAEIIFGYSSNDNL